MESHNRKVIQLDQRRKVEMQTPEHSRTLKKSL